MIPVTISATVYEGYSDQLTGKATGHASLHYALHAVPRKGDYMGTGYGQHPVRYVFWDPSGEIIVVLEPIYTGEDSQEYVLSRLPEPEPQP